MKANDIFNAYFKAKKHKKYSKDVLLFSKNFEENMANLIESVRKGKYNAKDGNYSFVVFRPKPREIFGTCFKNRIIHHLLDTKLRPIYEKILSPRTFNNRIGKGTCAAINQVQQDIKDTLKKYGNAYLLHLDIKGYFPNANVKVSLKQQLKIINKYYLCKDKSTLKFLMSKVMMSDPARNCKILAPKKNWNKINKEKSLFYKPVGTGGAIGFLCWQNAMGLYINDIIKWYNRLKYKITVFVDDIFIVSKDKLVLNTIPKLRNKLTTLKMQLNKKFYFQHYTKGMLVLGNFVRENRIYLSKRTIYAALTNVKNNLESINSYSGLFARKNSRRFFNIFVEKITAETNYVFNEKRNCFKIA